MSAGSARLCAATSNCAPQIFIGPVLGGVLVGRAVAASHVAAGAAQAQVHPARSGLEALLAPARARRHVADRIEMGAFLCHGGLLLGLHQLRAKTIAAPIIVSGPTMVRPIRLTLATFASSIIVASRALSRTARTSAARRAPSPIDGGAMPKWLA